MMAKMFYTLEETKAALGKSEDEVKQFARDGRLREFRDGPRLMFKADQVDQLRGQMGDETNRSDLGPSDSGILGLADTGAPSGSGVISLADTDFGKSPGAAIQREDTALAMDLGLSGSISGIPSPGRTTGPGGLSGSGIGMSPSPSGSRGGITVFDIDDAHKADPMAQTAIGSGIQDQVQLESVGSGSGLLDLTRESDDTSLGAELLDEINPNTANVGSTRRSVVSDSGLDMAVQSFSSPRSAASRGSAGPVFVEKPDALASGFGAMALFGVVIVLFGAFVLINALFGFMPSLVQELAGRHAKPNQGMMYVAGAALGSIIFFLVGWVIGKAGAARR